MSSSKTREEIWKEWRDLVNMAPSELREWLETDEANTVGADSGDGEFKGHKSGRRIVKIKEKNKAELTDSDYEHMAKVIGYIKRHTAQDGPDEDKRNSRWRYSLMNWGHDPLKT